MDEGDISPFLSWPGEEGPLDLSSEKLKNQIDKEGDASEEIQIAQFWDCNPYVSTHKGHLMFATKKITPGAHWILITQIACKNDNADIDKTIYG